MDTNTDIFNQLNSYFQPKQNKEAEKEQPIKFSAEDYRKLYEWKDKRTIAYVTIIGQMLGGVGAIIDHIENQGEIDKTVLLKILAKITSDAYKGFDEVKEIKIEI